MRLRPKRKRGPRKPKRRKKRKRPDEKRTNADGPSLARRGTRDTMNRTRLFSIRNTNHHPSSIPQRTNLNMRSLRRPLLNIRLRRHHYRYPHTGARRLEREGRTHKGTLPTNGATNPDHRVTSRRSSLGRCRPITRGINTHRDSHRTRRQTHHPDHLATRRK